MVLLMVLGSVHPAIAGTATESSATPPMEIIMVVDNSGSMKRVDPQGLVRPVMMRILAALPEGSRTGLVVFDATVRLAVPLTSTARHRAEREISQALAAVDYSGQFSESPAAIERAIYELRVNGSPDSRKAVVFASDGFVDTGQASRNSDTAHWLLDELTAESRRAGIRLYSVAFSDAADFSLLQIMAQRTGGAYFRVFSTADIPIVVSRLTAVSEATTAAPATDLTAAEATVKPAPVRTAPPVAETALAPQPAAAPPAPPPAAASQNRMLQWVLWVLVVLMTMVLAAVVALIWRVRFAGAPTGPPLPDTDAPTPEPEPVPEALLIDLKNISTRKTTRIRKPVINIGRGANSDVQIAHDTISGFHATIEYRDGCFFIEDQRSRNATFLNGKRLTPYEPARLKSGDELVIAVYKFIFMLADQMPSGDTQIVEDLLPESESPPHGPTETRPL